MLPPFHPVHLTEFRANMRQYLDWTRDNNGHLWLKNHNSHIVTIVPVKHAELIEEISTLGSAELRIRQRKMLEQWETVRMSAGLE